MSLRIGFISARNISGIACMERYKEIFDDELIDVIYWDRYGIEEEVDKVNLLKFEHIISQKANKLQKICSYLKFRSFVLNFIKHNRYDLIVIFPASIGLLFSRFLRSSYKNRYILDIRDYTAEYNPIFYKLEKNLISKAGIAIITSPAYQTFLPKHDYLVSHNIPIIDNSLICEYRKKKRIKKDKLVISCIGFIRFIDQFKKVIRAFANDNRFELRFIGRGAEYLRDFCSENSVCNVVLEGGFNSVDTTNYYADADIVMNLYGNKTPFLDYALSNKLYYAVKFGMPILVCPGTYMEKVAVENGFGFSFDLNDNSAADRLYEYYAKIDWFDFFKKCDDFMRMVNNDENEFRMKMREFLNTIDQGDSGS